MGYFYIYFMEEEVIKLYTTTIISMREIAVIYDTNHKVIGKILKNNNIPTRDGNKGKKRSDETKRLISNSLKGRGGWNKGRKSSYEQNMKNMYAKLNRPLLTFEKLCMFDDYEKLKLLNYSIRKYRKEFDDVKYINYLDKFWNCEQFNKIYNKWLYSGKSKWLKPSIDHIIPSSIGGNYDLDNLQFLSWFENRAKIDMSMDEWMIIKNNIKDYLI